METTIMGYIGSIGRIYWGYMGKFPSITVPKMGEMYIGPRIIIVTQI